MVSAIAQVIMYIMFCEAWLVSCIDKGPTFSQCSAKMMAKAQLPEDEGLQARRTFPPSVGRAATSTVCNNTYGM